MVGHTFALWPRRLALPAAIGLSFLALTSAPSLIPVVLLVATMKFYITDNHARGRGWTTVLLWLAATIGGTIGHLRPAVHALSSPWLALVILCGGSFVSAGIALIPMQLHTEIRARPSVPAGTFAFAWACTWLLASLWNPVGRLSAWSPLVGIEAYTWLRPWMGDFAIDYVVGAWAELISESLAGPLRIVGHADLVELDGETVEDVGTAESRQRRSLSVLGGIILALTLPSFFVSHFPQPPTVHTKSISVGCILPPPSSEPPIVRFLKETEQYRNRADILVWPEGAVDIRDNAERDELLEKLREVMDHTHVGISFTIPTLPVAGERERRLNGFMLVNKTDVLFTYYKRNLVPIAESFSLVNSNNPSPYAVVTISKPRKTPKTEWGADRHVPVSAGICLDLASPLALPSGRPALVLAPARTWEQEVGYAMWNLAKARGQEFSSDVLWCDGGPNSFSGVTGAAGDQFVQVGAGSWVKSIRVNLPFDERRTVFGIIGPSLGIIVFAIVGAGFRIGSLTAVSLPLHPRWAFIPGTMTRVIQGFAKMRKGGNCPATDPPTAEQSLIDA